MIVASASHSGNFQLPEVTSILDRLLPPQAILELYEKVFNRKDTLNNDAPPTSQETRRLIQLERNENWRRLDAASHKSNEQFPKELIEAIAQLLKKKSYAYVKGKPNGKVPGHLYTSVRYLMYQVMFLQSRGSKKASFKRAEIYDICFSAGIVNNHPLFNYHISEMMKDKLLVKSEDSTRKAVTYDLTTLGLCFAFLLFKHHH